MNKLFKISEEERNSILEQHKKANVRKLFENETMNEQLIKSIDSKTDASKSQGWSILKSKLLQMGFRSTNLADAEESSVKPLRMIYNKVGKRETLSLEKNGYKVDVYWPGGSPDAGTVDTSLVGIKLYNNSNKPNFSNLTNTIVSIAKSSPGLGSGYVDGTELTQSNDMISFSVNFQPVNISTMISKIITLLK